MVGPEVRLLLISGSTRGGSTNTATLRTAAIVAPNGVEAVLFGGLAQLPAFNPDHDHDPLRPPVADLRAASRPQTPSCSAPRSTPGLCPAA